MSETRAKQKVELDQYRFNLDTSFERGVDLDNRIIRLTEDIEDHHFDWFDSAMTALEALNRKTVTIKINSYGGDVYAALGIVDRIRESSVAKVVTKGYGKIMSAGTLILSAGDLRYMSKYAQLMIHEISYGVDGNLSHVRNEVEATERLAQTWYHILEEFTGTPAAFWAKKHKGKDVYLSPEKCLEYNLVDETF